MTQIAPNCPREIVTKVLEIGRENAEVWLCVTSEAGIGPSGAGCGGAAETARKVGRLGGTDAGRPRSHCQLIPAALGFDADDAAFLSGLGFNAVRITVERYAVEPTPGQFDASYVSHITDTVALLKSYGILSLIDFHQDEYGPVFFDNGYPDWDDCN